MIFDKILQNNVEALIMSFVFLWILSFDSFDLLVGNYHLTEPVLEVVHLS